MKAAHRAGQITGLVIILIGMVLVWRLFGPTTTPPATAADSALDAWDTTPRACITPELILRTADDFGLRWSEAPPLTCTDAPEGTTWLAVSVEDRTRYFAFGPDGCRIEVSAAPCP
jgi:hypothetical protein